MIGLVFSIYLLVAASIAFGRWSRRQADADREALMARIRDLDRTPRIVWVRSGNASDPEHPSVVLAPGGTTVRVGGTDGGRHELHAGRSPRIWTEDEVLRVAGLM